MIRAIYPGSFDPVTLGHLDIIKRSAEKVDELIIGVLNNNVKNPMFTVEERVEMLMELTKEFENVRVESFSGLSADFVKKKNANVWKWNRMPYFILPKSIINKVHAF